MQQKQVQNINSIFATKKKKCLDNPIFKKMLVQQKLKKKKKTESKQRDTQVFSGQTSETRVTALRTHQPRQRVWRVSIKGGQIQKRFANASASITNRQPLAPIWEWFLWDFSQEFLHVSPHQANVVCAAWDQYGPVTQQSERGKDKWEAAPGRSWEARKRLLATRARNLEQTASQRGARRRERLRVWETTPPTNKIKGPC